MQSGGPNLIDLYPLARLSLQKDLQYSESAQSAEDCFLSNYSLKARGMGEYLEKNVTNKWWLKYAGIVFYVSIYIFQNNFI